MEPPRIETVPAMRVVRRIYRGARPPAPEFYEHWRELHAWIREHGVVRSDPSIVMLGHEPPGKPGLQAFEYHACIPTDDPIDDDAVEIGSFRGGTFILVRGDLSEIPSLYREARGYAARHGIAFERGGIEIYRPNPKNAMSYIMDAGVGVHDLPSGLVDID